MSLDRRVAVDDPEVGTVDPTGAPEGLAVPTQRTRTVPEERLGRVPTQRGPLVGTPRPLEAPAPTSRRPGRMALLVGAVTATTALVVATGVVQHQAEVRLAQRQAEQARLAAVVTTIAADEVASDLAARDARIAATAAAAKAHGELTGAVSAAAAVLDASPHAGDDALAALRAAIEEVTGEAAAPLATVADLDAAEASLAAPVVAVRDAEAAWQAAETARIEAEKKAAEEAARKAAEEEAARKAAAAAAAKPAKAAKPSSAAAAAPAAAAPAAAAPAAAPAAPAPSTPTIPANGLVCPGAPTGAGAGESSVDAIGAGINAFRAANGLPQLAVGRSGGLVGHAMNMAAAGGIWHSGSDNIVGCTSGSVQSLIDAWAASPGHRAQMVRTDVSSMSVGGASLGGWLYGAVKFS